MKNKILSLMTMVAICTTSHVFACDINNSALDPKERARKIYNLRTELGDLYQQWQDNPCYKDVHLMYMKEREFWKLTLLHENDEKKDKIRELYKNVEIDDDGKDGVCYASSVFNKDIAAGTLLHRHNPSVDNKPLVSWNVAKDGITHFLETGIVKDGKYISYTRD